MLIKCENPKPPAPLPSREDNPFYLNINYLLGTHYLAGNALTVPLLYTTEITSCVAIGLFSWKDGKVVKLGLYHSFSEHLACDDELILEAIKTPFERNMGVTPKNLIRAIYHFLFDIHDLDNLIVVVHSNNDSNQHLKPENSLAYKDVVKFINHISKVIGKGKIRKENFLYSQNSSIFCVMNNGTYCAGVVDGSQDEKMARNVARFIYDDVVASHRNPGVFHGKSMFIGGNKKKLSSADCQILNFLNEAQSGSISWVNACFHIQQAIEEISEKDEKTMKSYENIKFMLQFLTNAQVFIRYAHENQMSPHQCN